MLKTPFKAVIISLALTFVIAGSATAAPIVIKFSHVMTENTPMGKLTATASSVTWW